MDDNFFEFTENLQNKSQNLITIKQYKVAACLTTYEDKEAAIRCLKAITSQSFPIQKILIVDNSQKPLLTFQNNEEQVLIKHHPENIGTGGSLSWAIAWATEQCYDFLWAFDQDSIVQKDCLSQLLSIYTKLNKPNYLIGIIAPTALDIRSNNIIDGAKFNHDQFIPYRPAIRDRPYECDSPITSGSLISLAAAKTISPPRADLFIDGVDLDYGLRLRHQGFHNLIVPSAVMQHSFGNPVTVKFFQKERIEQKYSALRHYYICRNHTYLDTRYAKGLYCLTSCLRRLKYMFSKIVFIMLYDSEDKALKIRACLLGTYHGLKGKLGKTWQRT